MSAFHENLIFNDKLPVKVILHTDPVWKRKLVGSHWHNSIELCYIVNGAPGKCRINGQSYVLKPHQFFVIGPNMIHSFDAVVNVKNEILTLLLPLNWLSDQIDNFNKIHFKVGPLDLTRRKYVNVENCMREIVKYKHDTDPNLQEQVDTICALHYLAAFVLNAMSQIHEDGTNNLELGSPMMIQEIMLKIQSDFAENITVSQLSEEYHLSETHLIRLFKKYVGVSPKNYLVSIRLNEASKLLRQTTKPIHEIVDETGFGSNKNFFVLFHKHFQMTPSEYRNDKSS